ncbi:phosphatase PAP2 family protein [Flagellimonas abyssi]|uniref:Phosphatase PAP2 family protein n=1 Tax=Flagellimonas abyssi TaxID=2864871 RepID=A0ABS7EVZ7_9FLAO|nr:phosphatase PAP2 family protein [Allomuricauda abyssi]MBW8201154.1 phosphatase PAP2 family protein [Allomuricauda abyssi]
MKQLLRNLINKIRGFLSHQLKRYDGKLPYIITVGVAFIIVILGINLFIELTDTLTTDTLATYDQKVTNYVLSFRNSKLTNYFLFMTHLGDVKGYLIVLALAVLISAFIYKRWKHIAQVAFVLALASISNIILKRAIDRARPGIEHLVSVETLSYPSGHAMSAMAFYGFLIYLFYTFTMKKLLKSIAIALCILIILSIGISRIYLGVHFPSDILGGFIAGAIWVFFCILLFNLMALFAKDPRTSPNP